MSPTSHGTGGSTAAAPPNLLRTLAPPRRGARAAKGLVYIALGVLLGGLYLGLLIASLMIGLLLGAFWFGLPIVLATAGVLWRCVALERALANRLLGAHIAPLAPLASASAGGAWERVGRRVGGRRFWRGMLLLALKLPLTLVALAAIAACAITAVDLFALGVGGISGSQDGYVGPFALDPLLGVLLCLLAAPVAVLTVAVVEWSAGLLRALSRSLLLTPLAAGAPVREALAQSLGDRTLALAYWLPDREEFVDEGGRPVALPAAGSNRAWTPVEHDGRRVAAIIHDASLEASPELLQAAAAAASLALDNEQLKADLRARVEELRASRIRIVEASNAARRRIERNLHDGAQQQLVALALELKLLRSRVGEDEQASEVVDRMEDRLGAALDELRELARGIHPGILTDRGLAPALEALAGRAPLPIACGIDLPDRPPPSVEAVAYFVVAEALTNVLKYAQARNATLRARYDGEAVLVELEDDGVGGADERRGSGLQGLRDRVGALDGSFEVISEPGAGTLVRARIPCKAQTLISAARGDALPYG